MDGRPERGTEIEGLLAVGREAHEVVVLMMLMLGMSSWMQEGASCSGREIEGPEAEGREEGTETEGMSEGVGTAVRPGAARAPETAAARVRSFILSDEMEMERGKVKNVV